LASVPSPLTLPAGMADLFPADGYRGDMAVPGPHRTAPRILETGPAKIRISVEVRGASPDQVFAFWTEPDRLRLWWPPEATIDLRPEGTYSFTWPAMDSTLRGRWLRVAPGRELEFTWTWDHEPEVTKTVLVTFRPTDGGTEVEVQHAPYTDSSRDVELRREHLDGWTHFLVRLVQVASAN